MNFPRTTLSAIQRDYRHRISGYVSQQTLLRYLYRDHLRQLLVSTQHMNTVPLNASQQCIRLYEQFQDDPIIQYFASSILIQLQNQALQNRVFQYSHELMDALQESLWLLRCTYHIIHVPGQALDREIMFYFLDNEPDFMHLLRLRTNVFLYDPEILAFVNILEQDFGECTN